LHNIDSQARKYFKGLKKSLRSVSEIHSYTLDLGLAIGLLKQCNARNIAFHVDGAGYRPAKLTSDEWREIAGSCRFHLVPRFKKGGVFHSKAWIFKNSLLVGSSNLSIGEARQNLNFWCWMPAFKTSKVIGRLLKNKSWTVFWDLNNQEVVVKDAPIKALESALAGIKMSSIIIVSPQPPSKKVLKAINPHLSDKGDCLLFLSNESHGLKELRNRRKWKVRNFIPFDESNGLHGKAFYGEWDKKEKPGAILYVGSANFTETAYKGKNIETGALIKAKGSRQVSVLRSALSSLLGKTGKVLKHEKTWATERFDGRWKQVSAPEKRLATDRFKILREEDIALSRFMDSLKAKGNCLFFPSTYGGKKISSAELRLGDHITRHWREPNKRMFAAIIWSPDARLKIVLKGGQNISIWLPPLDGLMEGQGKNLELLGLLLNPPSIAYSCKGNNNIQKDLDKISIYSDSRVLVPWRNFAENHKIHLFSNKKELTSALKSIRAILREPQEKDMAFMYRRRKLENIKFCLESLIEGVS